MIYSRILRIKLTFSRLKIVRFQQISSTLYKIVRELRAPRSSLELSLCVMVEAEIILHSGKICTVPVSNSALGQVLLAPITAVGIIITAPNDLPPTRRTNATP